MNIIIEGMDNSGKSTLATHLGEVLELTVYRGEGPPRRPGDMNDRLKRYLSLNASIFDRHPAISNPIYDHFRDEQDIDPIDPLFISSLYRSKPLFIYCDPMHRGLRGHGTREEVDTSKHLGMIDRNYVDLLILYRRWATERAHFIYRITDGFDLITNAVKGAYK